MGHGRRGALAMALLAAAVAAGCRRAEPSIEPALSGPAPTGYEEGIARGRAEKDALFKNAPDSPIPDGIKPAFAGLEYYPINSAYRFEGRVAPYPRPEPIVMTGTLGELRKGERWGAFSFVLEGRTHTLQIYKMFEEQAAGGWHYFLPFTDDTTGRETYPAGRYLDPRIAPDGRTVIDFNVAYYPFCAYGKDYDCPITPAENRLRVAIRAGERGWLTGVLPGPG